MILDLSKLNPDKLTPTQRARLDALRARSEDLESARALLVAQQADPEELLAQAEHEAALQEHHARVARAQRDGEAAYRAEVGRLGLHLVARVATCHGPIVLRCPDAKEAAKLHERTTALIDADQEQDARELGDEFIKERVLVYPSWEEYERIAADHQGVVALVAEAINAMLSGRTEIAGKGA